jgi:hypothetical protein
VERLSANLDHAIKLSSADAEAPGSVCERIASYPELLPRHLLSQWILRFAANKSWDNLRLHSFSQDMPISKSPQREGP